MIVSVMEFLAPYLSLLMLTSASVAFRNQSLKAFSCAMCMPLGRLMNQVVETANGGRMPVFTNDEALRIELLFSPVHKLADEHTRYWFLADWIETDSAHISLGDLVILFGEIAALAYLSYCLMLFGAWLYKKESAA